MDIRPIFGADVRGTAAAMANAGWPEKERQIAFFQKHPRCVGVVAVERGRVCGGAFGVANGRAGWLGLVFVAEELRGRGTGTALTRETMELLSGRGCSTFVLTATDVGRPVYERLGFRWEADYHGFLGPGTISRCIPEGFERVSERNFDDLLRFDRKMTGEDRSGVLKSFGEGWALRRSRQDEICAYHLPVPWDGGPAIAKDREAGEDLIRLERAIAGPDGTVRAWLDSRNVRGRGHLAREGFREVRVAPRMVLGESVRWRPESLWGVFSLAKG